MVPLIALAAVLIIAVVFIAALFIIRSVYKDVISNYLRLLAQRNKEYETLADRLFVKNRLAPSKTDLGELHQERIEQERVAEAERRLRGRRTVARGVGPVDQAQNDMIAEYRKTHSESVGAQAPASATLEQQIQSRQNTGAVAG